MRVETPDEAIAANSASEIASRVARLRSAMKENAIDVFYVGHSTDLEYLAGVERPIHGYGRTRFWAGWIIGAIYGGTGPVPLLVTRHLASGHLNERGAPLRGVDLQVVHEEEDPAAIVSRIVQERAGGDPRRIALNVDAPAELVVHLRRAFPRAEVIVAGDVLAQLRSVKSAVELEAMSAACRLVDQVFVESLEVVNPTISELALASWIEDRMAELGAIAPSFHTGIWTMGPSEKREAKERVSRRPIGSDTALNYDFGAGLQGYCSDFGRTVYLGKPSTRYREAYSLVIACQEAGRLALRPGAIARDVDRTARKVIHDGGYGEYFWHRLGHAIGKDTHEEPFLDVVDDSPLLEGMAFTIEPSIFIPGEFGCRVEDIFVVTPEGGRRLNSVGSEMRTL